MVEWRESNRYGAQWSAEVGFLRLLAWGEPGCASCEITAGNDRGIVWRENGIDTVNAAKAAAESAAIALLCEALGAFPCQAPRPWHSAPNGHLVLVRNDNLGSKVLTPQDALALGRALVCAALAASRKDAP